jgi:uncharacterized protein YkwD
LVHRTFAAVAVAVTTLAASAVTVAGTQVAGVVAAHAAFADTALNPQEADFVTRINNLRAQHGVGQLAVDDQLTSIARQWTASMVQAGSLSHNPNLGSEVTSNWIKLGENVGEGQSMDSLWQAFLNSPHHYANLVDPDFNRVGVGVIVTSDGTIWTTHDFEELAPSAPPSPPPAPIAGPVVHVSRPAPPRPATSVPSPPSTVAAPPPPAPAPAVSAPPDPPKVAVVAPTYGVATVLARLSSLDAAAL